MQWVCGSFTGSQACSAPARSGPLIVHVHVRDANSLLGRGSNGADDHIHPDFYRGCCCVFHAGGSLSDGYAGAGLLVLVP